jgi:uncharacterized protein (UPF0216 family)
VVYQVVKECFETYQQDVVKRMNEDIAARKTELSDLIKQKEAREIDRDAETQRLNQLDDQVLAQSHQVEDAYDNVGHSSARGGNYDGRSVQPPS